MSKINKDAFWELIAQGRTACSADLDSLVQWLEDKLAEMGPEAALEFDAMVHAYYSLAYKYGLWNAASIMCNGCTDDGFWDFLGWLIVQGREVYIAALKDPDSLAELPVCKNYWFPDIAYVGDTVYHRITGKDNGGYPDRETFDALKEELKKDIIYGDGVGYPHTWSETAAYLPRLCAKYMRPGELEWRIQNHNDTWNPNCEEIRIARAAEKKERKSKTEHSGLGFFPGLLFIFGVNRRKWRQKRFGGRLGATGPCFRSSPFQNYILEVCIH